MFEKLIHPVRLVAEGFLSLREIENVVEMVVYGFEAVQAVADPGGGTGLGTERPGTEIGDLVLELENQGVGSGGKTDGTDVMREGGLGLSLVRKREGSPENTDHGCDFNDAVRAGRRYGEFGI